VVVAVILAGFSLLASSASGKFVYIGTHL